MESPQVENRGEHTIQVDKGPNEGTQYMRGLGNSGDEEKEDRPFH